jgi:hypothetical protein
VHVDDTGTDADSNRHAPIPSGAAVPFDGP